MEKWFDPRFNRENLRKSADFRGSLKSENTNKNNKTK